MWIVTLDDTVRVALSTGVDATPRSRKARALIGYLACKERALATRSELIGLLWSDRGRDQARASLRQCLFELRADVPGLVETEGEEVTLAASVVARTPVIKSLHDLDRIDPAFDIWLATRRQTHAARRPVPDLRDRRRITGSQRTIAAGVAILAVIAGLGAALWAFHRPTAPSRAVRVVAILPWTVASAEPALRNVADRMMTEISAGMPASRVAVRMMETASPARARSTGADWVISGEVLGDARPGAVTARIQSSAGVLLWSKRIEASDNLDHAAEKVANWTASVIACATEGPRGVRRSDDVTALMMDACAKIYSGDSHHSDEDMLEAVRRWVAAAPRDSYAHGVLAVGLSFAAHGLPAGLRASDLQESEREARRSLSLDPTTAEAYLALGRLARDRREFAEAETLFLRGLSLEPDHAALANHLGAIMETVGRNDEALVMARRSLARDPTSPVKIASVADRLARTGQPRAAIALIDEAENRLGRNGPLACAKIFVAMRWDFAAAKSAIAEAASVPDCLEPARQAELTELTRAIERPQGPQAQALVAKLEAAREDPPNRAGRNVETLASLGRSDAALDAAQRELIEPSALFEPTTRPLLLSRRFPDIARRQGLWRYWQDTGRWPDICRDPALPWRCGGPVNKASTPD